MKSLIIFLLFFVFMVQSSYGQPTLPWAFTNTGINHTVIIPTSANPSINGIPLTNGDYVGVFYDSSGALVCAGYVLWTGTSNTAVSAFGDDPTTSGRKDGLGNFEIFKWKIWRHADGAIYDATATYSPPDGFIISDTSRFVVNGVSKLSSLKGTICIDGDMSESLYGVIATKQNSNSGFGSAIDVSKIVMYANARDSVLYVSIQGKLDVTNSNAIGVWLNLRGSGTPVGKAAGMPLGILNPGGSYIGGGNNPSNVNFAADFEVDYLFAFNPGGGTSAVSFDAAKQIGTAALEYQGSCNQTGQYSTNGNASGSVFQKYNIAFAFNNSGGANKGLELRIPFRSVGVDGQDSVEVFAFVVSGDAFFSDVTVPGNTPAFSTPDNPMTNLGYNPNFNTLNGAPYHSAPPAQLPVQLGSFSGHVTSGNIVRLFWTTISEINNYGFEVQKSQEAAANFQTILNSFIPGHGTTNEPQQYSYIDQTATSGRWYYRLKQIDLDGTEHFSEPIIVVSPTSVKEREMPTAYGLDQNYPNPFNPTTTIEFALPKESHVKLEVYNVLGQRVATLVNEVRPVGYYAERFNASGLASGFYIYRISAGDFVKVRKLVLMK